MTWCEPDEDGERGDGGRGEQRLRGYGAARVAQIMLTPSQRRRYEDLLDRVRCRARAVALKIMSLIGSGDLIALIGAFYLRHRPKGAWAGSL